PVALVVMSAQPESQAAVICERTAEGRAAGHCVVLPAAHLHATRPLVVRFGALHIDETGQRLCAVAAALRPSQDFDLFDVEQRGDSPDTAEVDVIDDETDGRVRCTLVLLQFAHAANLEIACAISV